MPIVTKSITVDIMPKGKTRPRFTTSGHAYNDPAQAEHERCIRAAWIAEHGIEPIGGGCPVAVRAFFYKPLPRSAKGDERDWTQKPDIDNLVKSVLDALNGVAYEDDKQIVELTAAKMTQVRDTPPRIDIVVDYAIGDGNGKTQLKGETR